MIFQGASLVYFLSSKSTIDNFNKIVDWIVNGTISDIEWEAKLTSDSLFKISKDFGDKVFIGIRGGINALADMDKQKMKAGQWKISMSQGSSNWIDGVTFYNTLKQKGF